MPQLQAADRPFTVILDEMGYYDQTGDDKLKIALRSLYGVENAEYVVSGDTIFVFDKLVELVKQHLKEYPDADVRTFAPAMVAGAMMPIGEAVRNWGIVPFGYRSERKGTGFQIWHTELMARLPKDFENMEAVNDAFVKLLSGNAIPGNGTFVFNGQSLIYTHSMDPDALPERPSPLRNCPKPKFAKKRLENISYLPGYAPVDEAQFARIQTIESGWALDRECIREDAFKNTDHIWALLENFSWDACNGVEGGISDYEAENLVGLRKLYPRLALLSDSALYHHFDAFEFGCRSARNWQANLDEGFLFYMLGEAAGCYNGDHAQEEFGEFVGHAILSGLAVNDAFQWGKQAEAYNTAVRKLAWRTASAMQFLKSEKTKKPGTGAEIFTFTDMFERSRSSGFAPVFVKQ